MKNMVFSILAATAFVTPSFAQYKLDVSNNAVDRQAPMIWTAFNLGGRSMTSSYDVKKFIETVHLTDQNMIDLFKQAEQDYNKYEELKSNWANKRMKDGVKQMAYLRMIQTYATRPQFGNNTRKAFTTTEREFFKEVQTMEDKALRELLNEGKGIVYARKTFGEQLIDAGYPRKESQSAEDVYWVWYELQKSRIKESMRIKEVQKYEYIEALGHQREFYVRPVEIFDFTEEVETIIEDKLENARITQSEANELIAKDDRLKVVLKGLSFVGPETTGLNELKNEANSVYRDFVAGIETGVISYIDSSFKANVEKYEAIASQMAAKYENVSKIIELSDQMKKDFIISNNYNQLVMAKIYDLAVSGIENGIYTTQNKSLSTQRDQYLDALSEYAKDFLSSEDKMLAANDSGVRLEDNFQTYLSRAFHDNKVSNIDSTIAANPYLNELRNLAHWVLKFQIKKVSLNTTPMAIVEKYDGKTFEGQDRIEKYLKNKQYEDNLKKFKTGKFKSYWNGILTINPTGLDYYNDDQAVNFVLGIDTETQENQTFNFFND